MNKDEVLQLAHEGIEIHSPDDNEYKVCAALIEALETKDEPLQSIWDTLPSNKDVADAMHMKRLHQLSTTPQRTWVGLTDDEICSLEGFYDFMTKEDFFKAIHAVEDKLRNKNT